jgi:chromosome segregation ATPase
MFSDNLLLSQLLAVVLALLAASLGWLAKSWSVRDRLSSHQAALKAKEEQVHALAAQVQMMEELRPAEMRQHLLRAKHQLEEHSRTLARRIEDGQSSSTSRQREIEDQRAEMNLIMARIADLEHRKELLQAFAGKLSELVQQFENGRAHLESGDVALKTVASENDQISAKIREDRQAITECQQRIADLEQERERLQAQHALLWENIRALEKRGDQLQAAADAIGSATDLLAAPPEETPRLIQSSGDLERIDVPKLKSY